MTVFLNLKYSVTDSDGLRNKWEAERLRSRTAESLKIKIEASKRGN